jgi:hypothetical protein
MRIQVAALRTLPGLTLFLLSSPCFAQTNVVGQLSCSEPLRAALIQTDVKFVELTSSDAIKQWKTRPVVVFEGYDAAKYGYTRAEFYRWHVPVPGREGYDQGAVGASTDRLALAVHVVAPRGDRWFELTTPADPNDGLLYIQVLSDGDSGANSGDEKQLSNTNSRPDEMQAWLTLRAATPDAKLPLFSLSYWHKEGGMYQVETFTNELFLDLRSGSPQISKALSCSEFEPLGGACSAQDQAPSGSDHLQCEWDANAADFRCTMTSPYGTGVIVAARTAESDFYLLSDKPAKSSVENADLLPDIGQLALRIQKNSDSSTKGIPVKGMGPVTLLQRFKDLLADADVFVFASPGAGGVWNSHLSLVTVSSAGKVDVQSISKWGIAGQATDESEAPKDFVPLSAKDTYRTHILEQRAGFRAFDAVLTSIPGQLDLGHVLYWIGLEAVDGKLVASAVRVATDGYVYGGCGAEYREGTTTSIRKKPAVAEATLRVQGQFEYEYTTPYPTDGPNCVWTSVLHWKPGAGFRARKLAEDCKLAHQVVTITEDGTVSGKDAKPQ